MKRLIKIGLALIMAAAAAESSQAGGDKSKADKKESKGTPKEANPPGLNIPIATGHEAKELKIPYYDTQGKLRMMFLIAVGKRVDENRLKMRTTRIETFDEEGQRDLLVDLPSSVLNIDTNIVSSDAPVTIRRADFELTGEGMTFDTRTRDGSLTGKVRMLIYDRDHAVEKSDG